MAGNIATAAAKKELSNKLTNSVLVEIIAKKGRIPEIKNSEKKIFKNVIIKNKTLMLKALNKLDKNTLGNIIGKNGMVNIVVADLKMFKEAELKKLTPNQIKKKAEENAKKEEEEYQRSRAHRLKVSNQYQSNENRHYSGIGNGNSNGTMTLIN